jgi:hypothetical protein
MTPIPTIRPWTLLLTALAAVGPAQEAPTKDATPAPAQAPAQDKDHADNKVKEWPALKPADRDRVLVLAGQFRKDNEELRKAARDELIAFGAGAAPLLFQRVNDKDESINDDLFAVFDNILGPEHAGLMAVQARKNKVTLRTYLLRRLCEFVDPEMKPTLQWATKDSEDDVVFYACLGLAALHDTDALLTLIELTRKTWASHKDLVAKVLPAARCDACGRAVAEHIAKAEATVQAAGLRLLRYVAIPDHVLIIRGYLAAEDHGVKKEAVNAMRVLHGEPPIENLSAFQAVEMAKEWQSK